jgi:quercetin dioxygenase-like cupin family protein
MEIYSQENISENTFFRTFSMDLDKYELLWHYDLKDRYMTVISGSDWMFQFDDCLPFKLNEGDKIFIPKNTYHRIIKGNGDLVIKIEEKK